MYYTGLDVISSHHDFANILSHRNDIAALSRETSASSLYKNHSSTSIINNTLSYLKANQSISEDMAIINNSTIQDHAEYDPKMKLPLVFDENDHNTGIVSLNHADIKILDSGNQATKVRRRKKKKIFKLVIIKKKKKKIPFIRHVSFRRPS